ncbi:MAG: hypothetical protein R2875_00990 [Desulfobacterales bacterium]
MTYMKKYGSHCMSFSTLQPGMRFFDLPGKDLSLICRNGAARWCWPDPICENDREAALRIP